MTILHKMKNKGFTIIELVIYLALFSIMLGGLIVTVFQLMESAGNLTSKDAVQEEINFVLKKMDWALADASGINSPLSGTSNTLIINKTNFSNNPIVFRLNTANPDYPYLEFCLNGTDCNPLTTRNVKVESLTFTKINGSPSGISMDLKINGMIITYLKYLRI